MAHWTGMLLAGALFALPVLGMPKPKEQWIEAHTQNFTLHSNCSRRLTTRSALALEYFRKTLTLISDSGEFDSQVPTRVFLFRTTKSFGEYVEIGDPWIPKKGIFVANPDGNYIVVDASPQPAYVYNPEREGVWAKVFRTIYHEYSHDYLHSVFGEDIPVWADEGLAEFYSSFKVGKKRIEVGRPIPQHVFWLREYSPIPLDRLFSIDRDSPEFNEAEKLGVFYAQSWALIHYLIDGQPDGLDSLSRFLHMVREGSTVEDALDEAFGTSYGGLSEQLHQYIRGEEFPFLEYRLGDLVVDDHVPIEPMERREVLYRLGDLLMHLGRDRWSEARQHFLEVLEVQPDHAGALAGLGELELAMLELRRQRLGEDEELHRKTLQQRRDALGRDHPDTLKSMNSLAIVYSRQGRHAEAEQLHRETLTLRQNILGTNHPDTLKSMNNLAVVYKRWHRYEDAETLHVQVLERRRQTLGEEHPDTVKTLYILACVAALQADRQKALEYLRRAVGHGYSGEQILDDPDLASLRDDPEFEAMVAKVKKRIGEE